MAQVRPWPRHANQVDRSGDFHYFQNWQLIGDWWLVLPWRWLVSIAWSALGIDVSVCANTWKISCFVASYFCCRLHTNIWIVPQHSVVYVAVHTLPFLYASADAESSRVKGLLGPWKWRHNVPSKRLEVLSRRHSVTAQKIRFAPTPRIPPLVTP